MDKNALLTQLGYNIDESNVAQIERILNNTDGLNPQSVIVLNDKLKTHLCYVAMSNSEDVLKIKNVATIPQIKADVDEIIMAWAQKNKMILKPVNETTYYIMGIEK
ncbi:MAG: type II secretion system protein [Campylobacter sp.]|nr:type II secretion system protein [Campylobacter sp.]